MSEISWLTVMFAFQDAFRIESAGCRAGSEELRKLGLSTMRRFYEEFPQYRDKFMALEAALVQMEEEYENASRIVEST